MKLHVELTIGGQRVTAAQATVALELGAAGWAEVSAVGDFEDAAQSPAHLALGYAEQGSVHRMLTGGVTDARRLERGAWRLRLREPAAALAARFNAHLRHVTPRQVLAEIEALTGVGMLLPTPSAGSGQAAGDYLGRRLPYFTVLGSCREALDQMGEAWGVGDAVWFTLPDGRVYWGSWAAGPYAGAALELPGALIQSRDPTLRTARVPPLPRLRPGMALRLDGVQVLVSALRFQDEHMEVSWVPLG
jgi:hypothetical protein